MGPHGGQPAAGRRQRRKKSDTAGAPATGKGGRDRRAFARRVETLTTFKVVDFLEAALRLQAAGRDIIRLETGEPGFPTPEPVRQAALAALNADQTRYTPSFGLAPLRQAIAHFSSERYNLDLAPERVIVTTGSSAALGMICDLLLNPGDALLLADPGYPCNANFVRRCGAEPVRVPVSAAEQFQLTPEAVAAHWRHNCAGVLLASPGNPTGAIISPDRLARLATQTLSLGGTLIVDEIYHGLTYHPGPPYSALNITDDVFVINSFSKYFGMTGWRLGWLVAPEFAQEPLLKMAQNFYISPPTIAQHAALAALHPDCIALYDQRREELCRRRDYLVPALRRLGFTIPCIPDGAFYIYAGIEALADDCEQFCWDMLHRAGVAMTPGTDFGDHLARQHVRLAYTQPLPRLQEAVERLTRVL